MLSNTSTYTSGETQHQRTSECVIEVAPRTRVKKTNKNIKKAVTVGVIVLLAGSVIANELGFFKSYENKAKEMEISKEGFEVPSFEKAPEQEQIVEEDKEEEIAAENQDEEKEMTFDDIVDKLSDSLGDFYAMPRNHGCEDPTDFLTYEIKAKVDTTGIQVKSAMAFFDHSNNMEQFDIVVPPGMEQPRDPNDFTEMALFKLDNFGKYTIPVQDNDAVPAGCELALLPMQTAFKRRTIAWFNRQDSELCESDVVMMVKDAMSTSQHSYFTMPNIAGKILWHKLHMMTSGGGANGGDMKIHLQGNKMPMMKKWDEKVVMEEADKLVKKFFAAKDDEKLIGDIVVEWKVHKVNDVLFHVDGTFIKIEEPGCCSEAWHNCKTFNFFGKTKTDDKPDINKATQRLTNALH